MRPKSRVGGIVKGGQPSWSFDMQGMPLFWVAKAEELHRMVELGFQAFRDDVERIREYARARGISPFHRNPSTLLVSFFLAALATENLLKAALVRRHPEYIKDGRFRGPIIASHDLGKIAADANVRLAEEEQDFCKLATECILHFGRYPIGKSVSESPSEVAVYKSAFGVYERLYVRLKADIESSPFRECTEQGGAAP